MKKKLTYIILLCLFLFPMVGNAEAKRIAGENRYETSVLLAQEAYTSPRYVLLAGGESYVDAIAGGVLGYHLEAPLIFVSKHSIPTVVSDALAQWDPDYVILLGGENSISHKVEKELREKYSIKRLAGANRYETAEHVNAFATLYGANSEQDVLVDGQVLADSLIAAPFAGQQEGVLHLYSDTSEMPKWIVGGKNRVPIDPSVARFAGDNRYHTSAVLATEAFMDATDVILANGENPVDALSAVNLANLLKAPILYVKRDTITQDVYQFIQGRNVYLVGGSASIGRRVEDQVNGIHSPNEGGDVLILMYHHIGHPNAAKYNVSSEEFRHHLQVLYDQKYLPVPVSDYVNGTIDLPRGYTPYVITFDDGSANNFWMFDDGTIDPNSGVGVLMDFAETHPGFHPHATFFVNKNSFGQPEFLNQKIEYLYANGMELGNHSYTHPHFSVVGPEETTKELATLSSYIESYDAMPYPLKYIATPFGDQPPSSWNYVLKEGSFDDHGYYHDAIFYTAEKIAKSPYDRAFDADRIYRMGIGAPYTVTIEELLEKYTTRSTRYYSDGNVNTVTIPKAFADSIQTRNNESIVFVEEE